MTNEYLSISDIAKKYGIGRKLILSNKNIKNYGFGKKYLFSPNDISREFGLPETFDICDYITPKEAASLTGLSITFFNDIINTKKCKSVKIGTRLYILKSEISDNDYIKMSKDRLFNKLKINERIASSLGDEYTILSYARSLRDKISIKHEICGNEYTASADNIIYAKSKCPFCAKNKKYQKSDVKNIIDNMSNGMYSLVGEYTSNKKYIQLMHNYEKCSAFNKKTFKTKLNTVLTYGFSCPYCSMSSGESKIASFFIKNNIDFEYQYHIDSFRFDFKTEKYLIEYDGRQHFDDIGVYNHDDCYKRDLKKNKLVLDKDLTLVRIGYKLDAEIENILSEIFIEKTFRDYPLGEYENLLGKSVILAENIRYIG